MKKISILGSGAFGTAISTILANNGYEVFLWCYEIEVVDQINNLYENSTFLPGSRLSNNIIATDNIEQCLKDSKWIFEAIPVKYLRNVLDKARPFITEDQIIVSLSKGIEHDTLFLPSQIVDDVLGSKNKIAVMSGPNFAKELAEGDYSVTMIASKHRKIIPKLLKILENSYFKAETSNDIIGVQVGGALKNLITLLIGIAKGSQVGKNAIAYLITKGLEELNILSKFLKGKEKTIYGLSGLGDLILTSTSSLSRNLNMGMDIGNLKLNENFNYKDFFKGKRLPEGINTVQTVHQLILKNKLKLPLCSGTYNLIYKNLSFEKFLHSLF